MNKKVFFFEAVIFVSALILGFVSGWRLKNLFIFHLSYLAPLSLWHILVWLAVFSVFLAWLVYFLKSKKTKNRFFKTIFVLAVIFGSVSFFNLWMRPVLSFILAFFFIFLWLKKPTVFIHNLLLIFAVAGVGARLGLRFTPEAVVLMLFVFSVYDYMAVYKTKHMVKIARAMMEERAIIGIVIPQKFSDFRADLNLLSDNKKFMVLGAGDIVFPLMLSVSLIPKEGILSVIVIIYALLGLFLSFLIFTNQKEREPMPALPPIAICSIIGYLLIRII